MANRFREQEQPSRSASVNSPGLPAAFTEPEVRRWSHPVTQTEPPVQPPTLQTDAALHYIHCALSYQNQLLADIKVLLEQMTVDSAQIPEEK